MLGAADIFGVELPGPVAEEDHEEEEEGSGDFEEDDSADAAEGLEKAAHASSYAGGGNRCLSCGLADGGAGCGGCAGGGGRGRGGRRGRGGIEALAGHASRDAESNAEIAANGLRFHPVYDVSSEAGGPRSGTWVALLRCPK